MFPFVVLFEYQIFEERKQVTFKQPDQQIPKKNGELCFVPFMLVNEKSEAGPVDVSGEQRNAR